MGDQRHDVPMGDTVAAQLVGHEPHGFLSLTVQQSAEESPRCPRVPTGLYEDVDQITVLIREGLSEWWVPRSRARRRTSPAGAQPTGTRKRKRPEACRRSLGELARRGRGLDPTDPIVADRWRQARARPWSTWRAGDADPERLKESSGSRPGGSYQTAWTWLHKLRRAMVRPGRDRLAGDIEVDETYVGGLEDGISGRGAQKKALIVVAAEDVGQRLGRIPLRRVPDASAKSLQGFIDDVVEPGSQVHTDGWTGYDRVQAHGYRHRITYLSEHPQPANELLPRVHLIASLLKRWLLGTHTGFPAHAGMDPGA